MLCLTLHSVFVIIELSASIAIRGKKRPFNCEGPIIKQPAPGFPLLAQRRERKISWASNPTGNQDLAYCETKTQGSMYQSVLGLSDCALSELRSKAGWLGINPGIWVGPGDSPSFQQERQGGFKQDTRGTANSPTHPGLHEAHSPPHAFTQI